MSLLYVNSFCEATTVKCINPILDYQGRIHTGYNSFTFRKMNTYGITGCSFSDMLSCDLDST